MAEKCTEQLSERHPVKLERGILEAVKDHQKRGVVVKTIRKELKILIHLCQSNAQLIEKRRDRLRDLLSKAQDWSSDELREMKRIDLRLTPNMSSQVDRERERFDMQNREFVKLALWEQIHAWEERCQKASNPEWSGPGTFDGMTTQERVDVIRANAASLADLPSSRLVRSIANHPVPPRKERTGFV